MSYSRTRLFGTASVTSLILLAGSMALAHPTELTAAPDCAPSGSATAMPSGSTGSAPSEGPSGGAGVLTAMQDCPSGSPSGNPSGSAGGSPTAVPSGSGAGSPTAVPSGSGSGAGSPTASQPPYGHKPRPTH